MDDSGSRALARTTRRSRGIAPYTQWRDVPPTDQRPRQYLSLFSHQESHRRQGRWVQCSLLLMALQKPRGHRNRGGSSSPPFYFVPFLFKMGGGREELERKRCAIGLCAAPGSGPRPGKHGLQSPSASALESLDPQLFWSWSQPRFCLGAGALPDSEA